MNIASLFKYKAEPSVSTGAAQAASAQATTQSGEAVNQAGTGSQTAEPVSRELEMEALKQQVRFLLADNMRMNQVIRELIYYNDLKRAATNTQTKSSFDFQWREIPEGKWMPSNPEFLQETPGIVLEWTRIPKEWWEGKRILDAGCGIGRWTYAMRTLGASVLAVDQSPSGLAATQELVKELGQVETQQADLLNLELEPQSFDLVWCFGVPHHTENPLRVLHNLTRLVKPGGYFFVMLYAFPEYVDSFRTQASYEEWRQRLLPCTFEEKVEILKQHYPPEMVHGYFDAVSPLINDLFTFPWMQAFLQNEGFEDIYRVPENPNHHVTARRKTS